MLGKLPAWPVRTLSVRRMAAWFECWASQGLLTKPPWTLTDHDWARNHAACLFWAVQRGPKPGAATRGHGDAVPAPNDAQVNASFEWVDVVTMLGIEATESVQTVTTQIPIITNTHAIASGDVIYLPPTAPKPKLPPPSKVQTWLTDLKKELEGIMKHRELPQCLHPLL